MSRVAKSDVHAALSRAAAIIREADVNKNSRIARAEIAKKIKSMPKGVERDLVSIFYKFADKRDHKPYAQLTAADLARTLEYAKEKLVSQYDKNNNGLSKAEIAKMSTTAKLAVELAKQLESGR
ncbi:MAG: hypothetical protein ACOZIN_04290 [Myxococcota bacterium]